MRLYVHQMGDGGSIADSRIVDIGNKSRKQVVKALRKKGYTPIYYDGMEYIWINSKRGFQIRIMEG